MKKLNVLLLFSVSFLMFGCPEKEDPKPNENDTRPSLDTELYFPIGLTKDSPWMPEILKCGETFESQHIKFTYRKATDKESTRNYECRNYDLKGSNWRFRIPQGTTFVLDVSYYKDISSIEIPSNIQYCNEAGHFFSVDQGGMVIEEIVPTGTGSNRVMFTKNIQSIKEVRLSSSCEIVDVAFISIVGKKK